MKNSCHRFLQIPLLAVLALTLAFASPTTAQPVELASAPEVACLGGGNDAAESLLWLLPEGIASGTRVELSFAALAYGIELFRETYEVQVPEATDRSLVLAVWLGGARTPDLLAKPDKAIEQLEVEILRDGVFDRRVSLTDLLGVDRRARGEDFQLVDVLSMSTFHPAVNEVGLGDLRVPADVMELSEKALRVCPGVNPDYCDIYFDLCIDDCQGSCYPQCQEEWEQCMYGSVYYYTTKTIESSRLFQVQGECGWYPWYKILSPKLWDVFQVIWRYRDWEEQHCPGGQVYKTQLNTWTEFEWCYKKTPFGCSGGSYMGGECRL